MSVGGFAADTLPFLVPWLLLAWRTGRFLPTWLVGVPAGVAVRMVVLGHYRWDELAFLLVSLGFIGTIVIGATLSARWAAEHLRRDDPGSRAADAGNL